MAHNLKEALSAKLIICHTCIHMWVHVACMDDKDDLNSSHHYCLNLLPTKVINKRLLGTHAQTKGMNSMI